MVVLAEGAAMAVAAGGGSAASCQGAFGHEPNFLEAAQADSPWGALAFTQPVDLGVIWLAFYVLDLRIVKVLSVHKWLNKVKQFWVQQKK